MDDATDSVINGSFDGADDDAASAGSGQQGAGTIDSVDGNLSLPFSVTALVLAFVLLYFTPLLDAVLGFGNPAYVMDPGLKLLASTFLAFGVGVFWEYVF
jgi:hypothetical protein